MIELGMVHRMIRRGALVAPLVIAALWLFGDASAAISGAVGIAMALGNLWLAARIIGGVAETNPQLLLVAGLLAFGLGLGLLTALAFGLQEIDVVSFPVTGIVLVGTHFVLVLWEAATAYPAKPTSASTSSIRSRS